MPSPEALFAVLGAAASRPALRQGPRVLAGGEVMAAIAHRAQRLRAAGSRRLTLALDNGVDWVLWDLAALQAGVVCVPLPAFFSPAQQAHVLQSAGIDTLIADDPGPWQAAGFRVVGDQLARREPASRPPLPEGTAKITYTSGTTGQPKGVCLDAATLMTVAASLQQASASVAIGHHLCALPLATLLENIAGIYAPLLAGAVIELMPLAEIGFSGSSRLDPARFVAALQRSRPHSLILVPEMLQLLVGAAERGAALPDSLRFVAVGGGRVSPGLLQRAELLGLPVYEGYGLSECASVVCLNTPGQRRIGRVGRPLPHAEVRIGAAGEVQVRGPRMLGYLGEPTLHDEWLDSGDLGHLEDGFLVLHGRSKHQFVTAYGRNVNPEWVESELVQQLPVAQAWLHGEALPTNVAVLVPRGDEVPDAALQAAVDAVNRELPDYARVHRWLRAGEAFSVGNGLATANGRLRRDALLSRYGARIQGEMAPEFMSGES